MGKPMNSGSGVIRLKQARPWMPDLLCKEDKERLVAGSRGGSLYFREELAQ